MMVEKFRRWSKIGTASVGGLLFGLIAPLAAVAQNLDSVEIKSEDLGNGFHMLMGAGGNLGLSIGEDGVFLIDDQYAPLSTKILNKIEALGGGDVRYVLNTHWHGDHTGGNEAVGATGAVIVAHKNVRKRMTVEQFSNLRNSTTPPSPEAAWPVVTFDGNVDFFFNGHKIEVMSVVPSHTDGDSIVYVADANIIHMGDAYFNTWYPFVDVDSGGDLDGMIEVHEKGLGLADDHTKIIPGHGPLATKTDLQKSHDQLVAVRSALQSRIDKGMSNEEIIADKPFEDLDLGWGGFLTEAQFIMISLLGMRS
jgi:cyclase